MPDCVKATDSWQRFGNKTSESPGKEDAMNQGFVDERQIMRLLDGYKELLTAAKRLV